MPASHLEGSADAENSWREVRRTVTGASVHRDLSKPQPDDSSLPFSRDSEDHTIHSESPIFVTKQGSGTYHSEIVIRENGAAQLGNNITHNHYCSTGCQNSARHNEVRSYGTRSQWMLKSLSQNLRFHEIEHRHSLLENTPIRKETCQWLFETNQYKAWESFSALEKGLNNVLVLAGKPGSGKSTLMNMAVRKYSSASKDPYQGVVTLYFFNNSNGAPLEHTKQGLYRSLLSQLLTYLRDDPDVLGIVRNLFGSGEKDWPVQIVERALRELLQVGCIRDRQLYLLLDALDECQNTNEPDASDVLKFLGEMSKKNANIRICISVRDWVKFDNKLYETPSIIEVTKYNRPSIESYLEEELERILSPRKFRPQFKRELLSILTTQSSNIFLWAFLVVDKLDKLQNGGRFSRETILRELKKTPTGLTKLYENLLAHASLERNNNTLALLQLIHVAVKPLTLADVKSALVNNVSRVSDDLSSDELRDMTQESFGDYISYVTAGLVEVCPCVSACGRNAVVASDGPSIVQFIHSSVREFLTEGGHRKTLDHGFDWEPEAQSHLCVAKICIRILSTRQASDFAASKDERPPGDVAFLQYASQFWTLHARKANDAMIELPKEFSSIMKCPKSSPETTTKTDTIFTLFEKYSDTRFYMNKSDIPCPPSLTCLLCESESDTTSRAQACEKNMLVLLAFEGCTNLVVHHAKKCRQAVTCHRNGHILHRAFFSASHRGWETTVKEVWDLAEKQGISINLNMRLGNGFTPLLTACFKGEADVADLLLRMGADPLERTERGSQLPLHAAVVQGYKDVVHLLLQDSMPVKQLLSQKDSSGSTVVHQAVSSGLVTMLKDILDYIELHDLGHLVHERNQQGETAHDVAETEEADDFKTDARKDIFRTMMEDLSQFANEIE